jgi:hypothetical protein
VTAVAFPAGGAGVPAYSLATPSVAVIVRPHRGVHVHAAVPAWELRFPDDALTYSRAGVGLRPERTGARLDLYA